MLDITNGEGHPLDIGAAGGIGGGDDQADRIARGEGLTRLHPQLPVRAGTLQLEPVIIHRRRTGEVVVRIRNAEPQAGIGGSAAGRLVDLQCEAAGLRDIRPVSANDRRKLLLKRAKFLFKVLDSGLKALDLSGVFLNQVTVFLNESGDARKRLFRRRECNPLLLGQRRAIRVVNQRIEIPEGGFHLFLCRDTRRDQMCQCRNDSRPLGGQPCAALEFSVGIYARTAFPAIITKIGGTCQFDDIAFALMLGRYGPAECA